MYETARGKFEQNEQQADDETSYEEGFESPPPGRIDPECCREQNQESGAEKEQTERA